MAVKQEPQKKQKEPRLTCEVKGETGAHFSMVASSLCVCVWILLLALTEVPNTCWQVHAGAKQRKKKRGAQQEQKKRSKNQRSFTETIAFS